MANLVQFDVDDTSPSISYLPFADTSSTPNLRAGWNPYFVDTGFANTPGVTGAGSSFHITSLDGAELSFPWHGTGIQLIGNATDATYTITLDGIPTQPNSTDLANNVLANFEGLMNTDHTIFLTARTTMTQNTNSFIAFDKASITAPPPAGTPANSTFTLQTLEETNMTFLGQWKTQNVSDQANSSYVSNIAGDRVQSKFMGTAFLLTGTTSPSSGHYSVTLDDITTNYTGLSSFTKLDSLLFFASGLDPQAPHRVEVVNDDGALLALQAAGFRVISLGDPTPPPPASPSPSPSLSPSAPPISASRESYPEGTILALTLAGVLAFILIVGFVLFILVYRPRRQRLRRVRREMRRKNHDAGAGAVLDIRPDFDAVVDTGNESRRGSGRIGLVGALGLAIKRSNSAKEKERAFGGDDGYDIDDKALSTKSAIFTTSSSKEKGKDAGTGKGKYIRTSKTESTSASFNIDLPSLHSRSNSDSRSEYDRPVPPLITHSRVSGLSQVPRPYYVPSPIISSRNFLAPGSNPNSNRISNAIPQSGSPSQSRSPKPLSLHIHSRTDSQGLLLQSGAPNAGSPDEDDYEPRSAPLPLPDLQPPRVGEERDRGSVHYGEEDASGMLWTASAKVAVKSLSPRTSYSRRSQESRGTFGALPEKEGHQEGKESSNVVLEPIGFDFPAGIDEEALLSRQREPERSGDRPRERKTKQRGHGGGHLLNVRESSPFRVDFGGSSSGSGVVAALSAAAARVSRNSGLSHVRFQNDTPEAEGDRNSGKTRDKAAEEERNGGDKQHKLPRITQSTFRLTPLSVPPVRPEPSDAGMRVITSFLDFGGSSDTSVGTRSIQTSGSSQPNRNSSLSVQPPSDRSKGSSASSPNRVAALWKKSWWSTTSHVRGRTGSSGDSSTGSRQNLPSPSSLPSPPPFLSSQDQALAGPSQPRQSPITDQSLHPLRIPNNLDTQSQLHSHPVDLTSIHTSPTDSIPVSDILFRVPDSEDASGLISRPGTGSRLPPQPADPVQEPASAPPSTPAFIVQRVLGIDNPAVASHGLGHYHGRSFSASGLLSTPPVRNEYNVNPSSRSSLEDKNPGPIPKPSS